MLWGLLALGQESAPLPSGVLLRLSVDSSRPGVGQEVELELPYAGSWPAVLDWVGVDEADGVRARWVADAAGLHRVRVGGVERVIQVQFGANRGPLPAPKVSLRPLPYVSGDCEDPRYPRLAGLWAVGCGPSGLVDRAEHVVDGRQVELMSPARSPALAWDLLYAPTLKHGLWSLPGPLPSLDGVMRVPFEGLGPAGTDGKLGAVTTEDDLQLFPLRGGLRHHVQARPAPWYPPAVGAGWVSWVDLRENGLTGEDVYTLPPEEREGAPLLRRVGAQRHVAASGEFLAWIEDTEVCVEQLPSGERRCQDAVPRTSRGLSLDGSVVCWEDYAGEDIDLRCSDGLLWRRDGHQRSPSRVGPWVLLREGHQVLLLHLDLLTLDDDDLRAEPLGPRLPAADALRGARVVGGGVRYRLTLPPGTYRVERHEAGQWVPGETVQGGELNLVAPWGDALRLRPEASL